MVTLISIDPGEATGIAIGKFTETHPYTLQFTQVIHDGLRGFLEFWDKPYPDDIIVSERFVLRNIEGVADTTPLLIEGALSALVGIDRVNWQLRTQKSLVPDQLLKRHGFWQTGAMVDHTDGRDVNDAIIHALAYLAIHKHKPTLSAYFRSDDE